jgi:hypothetical protein
MVLNLNKLKEYGEEKFKEDLKATENYKYITNMTETNFGKEMDKMTKEDWMKVADGAIEMQNKVVESSKFSLDKHEKTFKDLAEDDKE